MPRQRGNPFDVRRLLPRMSWQPANLYSLHERSLGQRANETVFRFSNRTVHWQRWKSKALLRGYHGDWIREKKFKQHWLPANLPRMDRTKALDGRGRTPLTSMMWAELEKRLDVAVFRACFADSVYEARRLVTHGHVRLNGVTCIDSWTRLAPGDLINVDAEAIPMLSVRRAWSHKHGPPHFFPPSGSSSSAASGRESSNRADTRVQASGVDDGKPQADVHAARPFRLPAFAAPFLFIPPYLEVSFRLASFIFLRPPTCGPGYSEIATPWNADGEIMRLAWEWYNRQGAGRRSRRQKREVQRRRHALQQPFDSHWLHSRTAGRNVTLSGRTLPAIMGSPTKGPQSDPHARRALAAVEY